VRVIRFRVHVRFQTAKTGGLHGTTPEIRGGQKVRIQPGEGPDCYTATVRVYRTLLEVFGQRRSYFAATHARVFTVRTKYRTFVRRCRTPLGIMVPTRSCGTNWTAFSSCITYPSNHFSYRVSRAFRK